MITKPLLSFNSGELSPLLYLRSDLEKATAGCRTLRNFLLTPYGGAQRRPGLAYTATCPGKARLFRFQAAIDSGFILEFSDQQIRFFKEDTPIQVGLSDYTVATPYGEDDLHDIQFAQINNVAYIVHPDYPVYKLSRITDSSWTMAEVEFSYPAMLSENLDDAHTLTTSAQGEIGDTLTLTSSEDLFQSLHVGAYFQVSHERPSNQYEVRLKAIAANNGQYSPVMVVQGTVSLRTQGTWDGTFYVERDRGDGYEVVGQYYSNKDNNVTAEFVEPERCLYRLRWSHTSSGSNNPVGFLETNDRYITGLIKVTAVTNFTTATVEVIKPVEAGATSRWREGAWSDVKGYPRTVTAHEQRLCFAGTSSNPQTIWGSAIDDYENFEPGNDDDDSWSHTLVSGQQNDIQWMVSQKALLIGTTGDEWVVSSSKDDAVISTTNVRARRHSGNGSDNVRALVLDDAVVFTQRGGRIMREMSYSFEADGYKTKDLTLLAQHITGTGIKEVALQGQPDTILWAVTYDGRLIGLTYDKEQNVWGWHRHTTGPSGSHAFESVAVRKSEGEADQVWVVVRRVIDGNTVRYIERFKPEGFFLEPAWSMLYGDTTGIPLWSTDLVYPAWNLYESYSVGDYRTHSGNTLLCVVDHTTDAGMTTPQYGNTTPGVNDEWVLASAWSGATAIVTGEYYYTGGSYYKALQDHTKGDPGTDPTAGGNAYWEDFGAYAGAAAWAQFNSYSIADGVKNGGVRYAALTNHTAAATNEPGVGINWATNWEADPKYLIDDQVVADGLRYTCIADHNPTTNDRPGTGVNWEDYWTPDQDQYTDGQLVSSDGINYICIQTHTPSAASEPGVGASWATYWELQTDETNLLFFVDSGITEINPGVITEVTGLGHLEGETVHICANNAVLTPRVVSGGAIQLDQQGDPTGEITIISVGLPYDSILEPMAIEVSVDNGTSVSRQKRIHELVVYVHESYGFKYGQSLTGNFDQCQFYVANDAAPPTIFTGPKSLRLDFRHETESRFVIKQDLPMPLHILAIIPKLNINGDTL